MDLLTEFSDHSSRAKPQEDVEINHVYIELTLKSGIRFASFGTLEVKPESCLKSNPFQIQGILFVPALTKDGERVVVISPQIHQLDNVIELLSAYPLLKAKTVLVTRNYFERLILTGTGVVGLVSRKPEISAFQGLTAEQKLFFAGVPLAYFVGNIVTWSILFLSVFTAIKLIAISIGLMRLYATLEVPKFTGHSSQIDEWPTYTVLVPLFNEPQICKQLTDAMRALDYPKKKLELYFLVEEEDHDTQLALDANKASYMSIFVVPKGSPQTKPRALQTVLRKCQGEFLTVYDAEDRPEPDQLKKSVGAFRRLPEDYACLQASLCIDHAQKGWLLRQFAFEYAGLFDVMLPWLARWQVFLPLGGTSNHFKRSALQKVGGWDPFNVTEDADLAVRLMRNRYKIGVLKSTTYEEAPTTLKAWLSQRSRWHKGWIQTMAVHLRNPLLLFKELGLVNSIVFMIYFVGGMLCLWFGPLTLISLLGLLVVFAFSNELTTPIPLLLSPFGLLGILSVLIGFGGPVLSIYAGARRRNLSPKVWELVTIPVYWLLASYASYQALWEFFMRPHHWRKTRHGLVSRPM
ncbi:glycosyltransferase [Flexibacterium corallicola]|uniref:glycosyltransferase n=1 Tax=Flexibacterium corallicola TaxID=3037259 RepID=UPI00286F21A5|nr:glycosyltransferase [Pseudovibrio sp. M1P-2-3]